MTTTSTKKNKKEIITSALLELGHNVPPKDVVNYIIEKHGIKVSPMYVYICREEKINLSPEAIQTARLLVDHAGSYKKAISAIRQLSHQDKNHVEEDDEGLAV